MSLSLKMSINVQAKGANKKKYNSPNKLHTYKPCNAQHDIVKTRAYVQILHSNSKNNVKIATGSTNPLILLLDQRRKLTCHLMKLSVLTDKRDTEKRQKKEKLQIQ